MHVCHFCDTSVGGEYFRNIVPGLTQNGVRVSLIELGKGTKPKWLDAVDNASYLSLSATGKWQYPLAVWRLGRFLRNENVDILHTHLFYSGLIGVLAKWLHRKTIVALMRHHTGVVRMLGSRFHLAADKWMAEKADKLMTVSEAARSYMLDVDKIGRDDIKVVYNGSDLQKFSPNEKERGRVRREFGFGDKDFVIGYVGSFAPGKGQLQLIEAFSQIQADVSRARLFLIGGGVPSGLENRAKIIGKNWIVFAGQRNDIPACLNAMDLFVQPSLSEAFSQVLIEAMGVGQPVIATDVGGASEVVENGINGVLIEADDPEQIAVATIKLYEDSVLRKKLSAASMKTVRERFSSEQMVARQMLLYRRWLDQK